MAKTPQHPLPLVATIKREPPDPKDVGWLERGGTSGSDTEGEPLERRSSSPKNKREERSLRCAWCGKPGQSGEFSLRTPGGGKVFCSEQCFTLCRRASFKRNKTCDWCRHVRHTVSYVDFQDGHHQLQFCSDKCLNQYKMNLFCKETEAQLEAHPHLRESGGEQGLITPELWLRDCRSPESERSLSPPHLDTKKQEEVRKEVKKKTRSRPRRAPSPPRVPLFPPPPLPPWRRKPEMPGLVPLRPLPLLLPPPTTLVPYPFFLPVPIPIPIPIPLPGIKLSDLQPTSSPSDPSQPRKRKRLPDEPDSLGKHESVHA